MHCRKVCTDNLHVFLPRESKRYRTRIYQINTLGIRFNQVVYTSDLTSSAITFSVRFKIVEDMFDQSHVEGRVWKKIIILGWNIIFPYVCMHEGIWLQWWWNKTRWDWRIKGNFKGNDYLYISLIIQERRWIKVCLL